MLLTMVTIENCLLTFSLKKRDLYISCGNGFLIFGELIQTTYTQNSFLFYNYELNKIFDTLISISEFFANEEFVSTSKNFVKMHDDMEYGWQGKTIQCNQTATKIVQIMFSSTQNTQLYGFIAFEMCHIDTLIKSIRMMYFSTLKLSNNEKFFLDSLVQLHMSIIQHARKDKDSFILLLKETLKIENLSNVFELRQLFLFYFDEILIISKLHAF